MAKKATKLSRKITRLIEISMIVMLAAVVILIFYNYNSLSEYKIENKVLTISDPFGVDINIENAEIVIFENEYMKNIENYKCLTKGEKKMGYFTLKSGGEQKLVYLNLMKYSDSSLINFIKITDINKNEYYINCVNYTKTLALYNNLIKI